MNIYERSIESIGSINPRKSWCFNHFSHNVWYLTHMFFYEISTWWLIPLSKWVITPVINGISRVNTLITWVITHLLSGMSHQVGFYPAAPGKPWILCTARRPSAAPHRDLPVPPTSWPPPVARRWRSLRRRCRANDLAGERFQGFPRGKMMDQWNIYRV